MTAPIPIRTASHPNDAYVFFVLACAITWLLDVPMVAATLALETPGPVAMLLAGLGAWGPTFAALLIAYRRRELRGTFGQWRTDPIWIVLAFFAMTAIHLPATLIEVALGGQPAAWFYPPSE